MTHQNQGTGSPADPPLKRKRGRPRKDENLVQGENTPQIAASGTTKKNRENAGASNATSDDMVGQVVSGVIEGSFDAGYLLSVKVADTDTHLRGVVFLPGRFTPVTPTNDVAPHAKMYKREEIPFPFKSPQSQKHDVDHSSSVEIKTESVKLPDQVLPTKSGIAVADVAGGNQSASLLIPPASNLPNDTSISLREKVFSHEGLDSALEKGKAIEQVQLIQGSEKNSIPVEGPNLDLEAPAELEQAPAEIKAAPSEIEPAPAEIKPALTETKPAPAEIEPASASFNDILSGNETTSQEPQVEHQAISSGLKPDELVHDNVQSPNHERNQTPTFPEPEPMVCEPVGIDILMERSADPSREKQQDPQLEPMVCKPVGIDIMMEKQAAPSQEKQQDPPVEPIVCEPVGINIMMEKQSAPSREKQQDPQVEPIVCEPVGIDIMMEKQAAPSQEKQQDLQVELVEKIMNGDGTSKITGMPVSGDATTDAGLDTAPMTNLPAMISGAELNPSEPKPAAEEPVLPRVVEPQICSSSVDANTSSMDCSAQDAIPPAQS